MEQQETQHQTDVEALQKKHDDELKALQARFNEELTAERAKLEEEKEADLARLQEALRGNLSQQQELQLQMLKEHHDRELEAVREELVRTHMEKFTEMTAQLEAEHGVCLLFVDICRWMKQLVSKRNCLVALVGQWNVTKKIFSIELIENVGHRNGIGNMAFRGRSFFRANLY